MSFKKKVFLGVGPVIVALSLLLVLFIYPYRKPQLSNMEMSEAATALNKNVYKGDLVVNQGLENPRFVPFIGASELSRFNMFHPSVLAEKYDRNYRPFLLGLNGTTLLNQYMMLHSLDKAPASGKIVVIVSLASFEDNDYQNVNFSHSYSNLQGKKWLSQLDQVTENDEFLAERLLQMPGEVASPYMRKALSRVSQGKPLTLVEKGLATVDYRVSSNAEFLFSVDVSDKRQTKTSDMYVYQKRLDRKMKALPTNYDINMLEDLAKRYGRQYASGNDFKMYDAFYTKSVTPILKKYKGFYKDRYHGVSKGFGELELLLSEIADRQLDAYFILPTMHEKWRQYTGLSENSITDLNKKITKQLNDQGFNQVLDMNAYKSEDYVMQDPLHIGWKGWVEVDRQLKPFLEGPKQGRVDYQLDPYFASKDWQAFRP